MNARVRRAIVEIGEGRCIGCGLCLPDCPPGALEIPDGTSRLIDDRLCDGCGACVDACPERAIRIAEHEARPFELRRAMERLVLRGEGAVKGYLECLAGRGESALYCQAIEHLGESRLAVPGHCRAEVRAPDAGNGDDAATGTVSEVERVRSG